MWTANNVPDLQDRTIVVTGANGGLGLEASRMFAARGARVVMACRSLERGHRAAKTIGGDVAVRRLDLADLDSVRTFASELETPAIDVLVNNAGVMALPYTRTAAGFELQLAVNHFGHFALTGLLLPKLTRGRGARVVTVSSLMHKVGRIDFDNLDGSRGYAKWSAYAQSKLANLLFAYELDRRLKAAGTDILSVAAHPGYAATGLQAAGAKLTGSKLKAMISELGNALFAQSAQRGALPVVFAASDPTVTGGDFVGPDGMGQIWGYPTKVPSSRGARNQDVARRLWEVSAQQTGVDFEGL